MVTPPPSARPAAAADRATVPPRPAAAADAALLRRLRRADAWRHRLDATLVALGQRRGRWSSRAPYLAGNIALDLLEALRTRRRPPHPGHPHLAALEAAVRLPQDPRHRGYWYDPGRHSLVGLQLGLDLNRHRGRYHLVESNVAAAMRPERRRLYDGDLDPAVSALAAFAAAHRFERLVLLRRWWTRAQLAEFERASRAAGVEVVGATIAAEGTAGHPRVNPMLALPEPLPPRTMHVLFTPFHLETPLVHFLHDKAWTARWLPEAMAEAGPPVARLASIPTFDRPVLPAEPPDGRWPNLVAKLADVDGARAVAMGRFATEEEARRGLGLRDGDGSVPEVLRAGLPLPRRILRALFPGEARVLYQHFLPPEVVDGRARLIRLHVLVSPLADAFLSAHGVLAGQDLPGAAIPAGPVGDPRAYVVNYSTGGRYCRLPAETEAELREAAREFGRLAGLAIRRRFVTSP